ncbi:MAG: nuclease A inhibitor family protein [Saprospiraceae bacterium]
MAWYDYIKGFFYRPPNEDRNEDVEELIEILKSMSEDLLFTSESDYPFEVICWSINTEIVDITTIQQYIDNKDKSIIKELTPDKMLSRMAKSRPYYSTERREKANRFRQIITFFESQVANAKAFKIGEVEIDIYIIGTVGDSHIIGLKTMAVET